MRVLVFSYYFPPGAEVGGKRFSALARQWEEGGIKVITLAAEKAAYRSLDESQNPPGTVFRCPVRPLPRIEASSFAESLCHRLWKKVMIYIDIQQGWIKSAVGEGVEIGEKMRPDVVITTGPPFSAFVAGAKVSYKLGLPLVLDYRDPWTTQRSGRFPPPLGPIPGKMLEKKYVGRAKAVVCCSDRLKQQVSESFRISDDRIYTLTNGFNPVVGSTSTTSDDRFTILYAGTFYGRRSLAPLLEGVVRLKSKAVMARIRVLGPGIPRSDSVQFRTAGVGNCLESAGDVPYEEALREMRSADLLYLPSGDDVQYALPFKLFDYLSAEKPILSVSPQNSAVAEFIERHRCGRNFTWDDSAGIADYLEYLNAIGSVDPSGNSMFNRDSFHWSTIAKRYTEILEGCAR